MYFCLRDTPASLELEITRISVQRPIQLGYRCLPLWVYLLYEVCGKERQGGMFSVSALNLPWLCCSVTQRAAAPVPERCIGRQRRRSATFRSIWRWIAARSPARTSSSYARSSAPQPHHPLLFHPLRMCCLLYAASPGCFTCSVFSNLRLPTLSDCS